MCGYCPPGYAGNGEVCSYQGLCAVNNGGCHHLAQCRDNPSKLRGCSVLNLMLGIGKGQGTCNTCGRRRRRSGREKNSHWLL